MTTDEMKQFLAIFLVMCICSRLDYKLYWSIEPILEMPRFRKIMSRNRFLWIMSFCHLGDQEKAPARGDPDSAVEKEVLPGVKCHHSMPNDDMYTENC